MKKIILLITLSLFFISCELNTDEPKYNLELVNVNEVEFPLAFAKDSTTNIPVKFLRPTSCHFFDSFYYLRNGFDRTVAIYCAKANQTNCVIDNVTPVEVILPFRPTELGTYHFRFLSGEDADGVLQFIEFNATVDH